MTEHDRIDGDNSSGEDDSSASSDQTDADLELQLDAELAGDEGLLGHRLRELLAPEDDLFSQTTHQVDRTLRARSALAVGMDLLGLGWLTMRELLTDEPSRADGEREGT